MNLGLGLVCSRHLAFVQCATRSNSCCCRSFLLLQAVCLPMSASKVLKIWEAAYQLLRNVAEASTASFVLEVQQKLIGTCSSTKVQYDLRTVDKLVKAKVSTDNCLRLPRYTLCLCLCLCLQQHTQLIGCCRLGFCARCSSTWAFWYHSWCSSGACSWPRLLPATVAAAVAAAATADTLLVRARRILLSAKQCC